MALKRTKPRPFLKWAGGKTQLLKQLRNHYPADRSITRYVEPFLGSGAVFIDVIQKLPIEEAYLVDVNKELILAFWVVQNKPDALIIQLNELKQRYLSLIKEERKIFYYQMRDQYNDQRDHINYKDFSDEWISRAAAMIFLNKTCYNGLYRVNSKGEFNVPCGSYDRPKIFDEENIRTVSHLLKKAKIVLGKFEDCARFVNDHSFVYFDPPYRPISRTSNFTSYSRNTFTDEDQRKLGHFYTALDVNTDARLMLSNSDPQNSDPNDRFFQDLYAGFNIHSVSASRMINSNAGGRGKINELLITNY